MVREKVGREKLSSRAWKRHGMLGGCGEERMQLEGNSS